MPSEPVDWADQKAITDKIDNGTWISAQAAREMVSQEWRDEGKATDAICLRARLGHVLARASIWVTFEGGQKLEKPPRLIEREFWADDAMRQDWLHGDFRSITYPDGNRFEAWALGVKFELAGIKDISSSLSINASKLDSQRGRPKGSGGYAQKDAQLVEKMREYIVDHPGTSSTFAAGKYAAIAEGGGTEESKKRRLAKRYRDAYAS